MSKPENLEKITLHRPEQIIKGIPTINFDSDYYADSLGEVKHHNRLKGAQNFIFVYDKSTEEMSLLLTRRSKNIPEQITNRRV